MKAIAIRTAALAVLMTFLAAAAGAQSLAEIARKMKAEHAKQGENPAKVYTNDNIPHVPSIQPSNAGNSEAGSGEANSQPKSSNPAISLAEKASQSGSREATAANNAEEQTSGQPTEDKKKTKAYWQAHFKQDRQVLALAKEHQELVENEMNLLELQQARELDPNKKADLGGQITSKQAEVATRKAETAAAQNKLDELEKAFKASGAPEDWSKTE